MVHDDRGWFTMVVEHRPTSGTAQHLLPTPGLNERPHLPTPMSISAGGRTTVKPPLRLHVHVWFRHGQRHRNAGTINAAPLPSCCWSMPHCRWINRSRTTELTWHFGLGRRPNAIRRPAKVHPSLQLLMICSTAHHIPPLCVEGHAAMLCRRRWRKPHWKRNQR